MYNRPIGVKKSQFIGDTAAPPSAATFDYVYNGRNTKITFTDLIASLGVTGSIEQGGDPLGYPVLDTQGSVNVIRNLVEGFGISVEITPENDLKLSTNFSFDDTGARIVDDPESPAPNFRSIVAGSGITVGASAGRIQISATDIPQATKTITVYEESDFGAPVAGVYTLDADTDYFIVSDITTNNSFYGEGTVQLRGTGDRIASLTYTGAGTMFVFDNPQVRMFNLTINCNSSPTSTWLEVTSDGSGSMAGERVDIMASNLGEVSDLGFFDFGTSGFNITDSGGYGLKFLGTTGGIFGLSNPFIFNMGNGIIFDLGTVVFEKIDIQDPVIFNTNPSATFISGLPDSGNISSVGTGGTGTVRDGQINGSIVEFSGIDSDDDRWIFKGNNTIRDTRRDAIVSTQGNTTATTISALSQPEKMVSVFSELRASGFSSDATGTITNTQTKGVVAPVTMSISGRMDSSTDKDCIFYIAKGVAPLDSSDIITETAIEISLHRTKTYSATLVWQGVIEAGESIELWGEQVEGPVDDIILRAASIRID
jgi:hypothetical protein